MLLYGSKCKGDTVPFGPNHAFRMTSASPPSPSASSACFLRNCKLEKIAEKIASREKLRKRFQVRIDSKRRAAWMAVTCWSLQSSSLSGDIGWMHSCRSFCSGTYGTNEGWDRATLMTKLGLRTKDTVHILIHDYDLLIRSGMKVRVIRLRTKDTTQPINQMNATFHTCMKCTVSVLCLCHKDSAQPKVQKHAILDMRTNRIGSILSLWRKGGALPKTQMNAISKMRTNCIIRIFTFEAKGPVLLWYQANAIFNMRIEYIIWNHMLQAKCPALPWSRKFALRTQA